jgi:hypothetical protein
VNLRSNIIKQESLIQESLRNLEASRNTLTTLYKQRQDCSHQFELPRSPYLDEGGTCVLCGINEIHASCAKIGAKYNN